jgi:hypothetical protein
MRNDEREARGCLFGIALIAVCISVGGFFGWQWGFVTLAVICCLMLAVVNS